MLDEGRLAELLQVGLVGDLRVEVQEG